MQTSHNNNFDALRLFAAICVMFSHSYMLLGLEAKEPLTIFSAEWYGAKLGLYIFFVISGYLVTASLLKNPRDYFRNRALRVYPALIVNVAVTAFLLGALITTLNLSTYFRSQLFWSYLQNASGIIFAWKLPGVFGANISTMANGSLWTLGQEIVLYIIIWCISVTHLNFRLMIISLIVVTFALNILGFDNHGVKGKNFQITLIPSLNLSLYFLIGSAFYAFKEKIIYKPLILIILLVIEVIFYLSGSMMFSYIILPYLVLYIAFSKKIKLQQTAKYGDFSYGIYIYAYPIQQSVITLNHGQISPYLLFCESLPVTLFCAYLSWHLIEKKALALKFRRGKTP